MSLQRLFWIGAATLLGAAALTAIAAILKGNFSETDAKIVGTSFSLLVGGTSGVLGVALGERRHLEQLGLLVAVAASLETVLFLVAIWSNSDSETLGRWVGTAGVLLLAQLLLTGQALVLRGSSPRLLSFTGAAVVIASAITISAFWADNVGELRGKSIAVFWILAIVGFLATPIVNKLSRQAPLEDARQDQPSAIEIPPDSTSIAEIGDVEVVAAPSGATTGLIIGVEDGRLTIRFGGGRRQLEAGDEIQLRPRI
jgi:hypothetical protein